MGALTSREVTRFISPPPTTVAGFERFIEWASRQRVAGEYACFAVVPTGADDPVGIIQVRQLNGSFDTAEWGFAIAPAFWGTGLFPEAARLVLAFCFRKVGVRRLEARAATVNGRGNGAMRKLGASRDALLKCSFNRDGRYFDQFLWSIRREDWEMSKAVSH
jgi:ribosomal-protein-alanine N-acetyltransferase